MMLTCTVDASFDPKTTKASGAFVCKQEGKTTEASFAISAQNNHEAEWIALLEALKVAKNLAPSTLLIVMDSSLVVNAIEKRYVKAAGFQKWLATCLEHWDTFPLVFIKWGSPKEMKRADTLAREHLYKQ